MLPWQWILMAAVAAALVILGVLVLGTIYGVVIGVLLSFVDVIRRASQRTQNPYRRFYGGRK